MFRVVLFLLIFPMLALAAPHDTTVRLDFSDGTQCSGTVVGPRTVLTAWHCVDADHGKTADLIKVDGFEVLQSGDAVNDGQDHALVMLSDGKFSTWAKLGRMPPQTGQVFIYGNPLGYSDLFRTGQVAGMNGLNTLLQLPVYPGDSGSGVFDKDGKLVGVVSEIPNGWEGNAKRWRRMDAFTTCKPIRFTAEQWREALKP